MARISQRTRSHLANGTLAQKRLHLTAGRAPMPDRKAVAHDRPLVAGCRCTRTSAVRGPTRTASSRQGNRERQDLVTAHANPRGEYRLPAVGACVACLRIRLVHPISWSQAQPPSVTPIATLLGCRSAFPNLVRGLVQSGRPFADHDPIDQFGHQDRLSWHWVDGPSFVEHLSCVLTQPAKG